MSGKTALFGIFGHPVSQSRSPVMHNAAFKALGMNCRYDAYDIAPGEIRAAVEKIRSLPLSGVNITVPHKRAFIPEMDFLSPEAQLAGAVNTVKNEGGRLSGYNTDTEGALTALREVMGFSPEGGKALVVGAGGAAGALVPGLCMKGAASVFICNRTAEKAESLGGEFAGKFPRTQIETCGLSGAETERFMAEADIVINCSSAGMEGNAPLALPLERFGGRFGVYDLVYKPRVTPLVAAARELGIKAESGIDMLLYQGAKSFEIWTGARAPLEVMRKALGGG
ncbi:MAG: shikimate dehydrogenase [Candidatus Dadabacteria bacterium]|nr:shikimate dehydrogenase [Candidatus Dadabacteria bacterium]